MLHVVKYNDYLIRYCGLRSIYVQMLASVSSLNEKEFIEVSHSCSIILL